MPRCSSLLASGGQRLGWAPVHPACVYYMIVSHVMQLGGCSFKSHNAVFSLCLPFSLSPSSHSGKPAPYRHQSTTEVDGRFLLFFSCGSNRMTSHPVYLSPAATKTKDRVPVCEDLDQDIGVTERVREGDYRRGSRSDMSIPSARLSLSGTTSQSETAAACRGHVRAST